MKALITWKPWPARTSINCTLKLSFIVLRRLEQNTFKSLIINLNILLVHYYVRVYRKIKRRRVCSHI